MEILFRNRRWENLSRSEYFFILFYQGYPLAARWGIRHICKDMVRLKATAMHASIGKFLAEHEAIRASSNAV